MSRLLLIVLLASLCQTRCADRALYFTTHSGFNNQRKILMNALVIAGKLNRTLLLPPVLGWGDAYNGKCTVDAMVPAEILRLWHNAYLEGVRFKMTGNDELWRHWGTLQGLISRRSTDGRYERITDPKLLDFYEAHLKGDGSGKPIDLASCTRAGVAPYCEVVYGLAYLSTVSTHGSDFSNKPKTPENSEWNTMVAKARGRLRSQAAQALEAGRDDNAVFVPVSALIDTARMSAIAEVMDVRTWLEQHRDPPTHFVDYDCSNTVWATDDARKHGTTVDCDNLGLNDDKCTLRDVVTELGGRTEALVYMGSVFHGVDVTVDWDTLHEYQAAMVRYTAPFTDTAKQVAELMGGPFSSVHIRGTDGDFLDNVQLTVRTALETAAQGILDSAVLLKAGGKPISLYVATDVPLEQLFAMPEWAAGVNQLSAIVDGAPVAVFTMRNVTAHGLLAEMAQAPSLAGVPDVESHLEMCIASCAELGFGGTTHEKAKSSFSANIDRMRRLLGEGGACAEDVAPGLAVATRVRFDRAFWRTQAVAQHDICVGYDPSATNQEAVYVGHANNVHYVVVPLEKARAMERVGWSRHYLPGKWAAVLTARTSNEFNHIKALIPTLHARMFDFDNDGGSLVQGRRYTFSHQPGPLSELYVGTAGVEMLDFHDYLFPCNTSDAHNFCKSPKDSRTKMGRGQGNTMLGEHGSRTFICFEEVVVHREPKGQDYGPPGLAKAVSLGLRENFQHGQCESAPDPTASAMRGGRSVLLLASALDSGFEKGTAELLTAAFSSAGFQVRATRSVGVRDQNQVCAGLREIALANVIVAQQSKATGAVCAEMFGASPPGTTLVHIIPYLARSWDSCSVMCEALGWNYVEIQGAKPSHVSPEHAKFFAAANGDAMVCDGHPACKAAGREYEVVLTREAVAAAVRGAEAPAGGRRRLRGNRTAWY